MHKRAGWLVWIFAGIWGWSVAASALEPGTGTVAGATATNEISAPVENPDATNNAENTDAAVSTNAPPDEEETAPNAPPAVEVREPVTYRGADLRAAFKGSGSSRFGLDSRVRKIHGKTPPEKPETAWREKIELGMETARGNSDFLRYNGKASAAKETEADFYYLEVGGRYGQSGSQTDAENATGEAKYQRRLSERMYAGANANVRHDQIAALSYRALGNLSLGRHFMWTDRTTLSAELGPGYVLEKKGGVQEGFVAGRAAGYLDLLLLPTLRVWQSVEYIPNLEDSSVYFINAEVGFETVLIANLSLRFTVEDLYDSAPADGKENYDLSTSTALAWSF